MTFVVFSLPRSRSAWLSTFLGAPGRAVGHDIGVTTASPAGFAWRIQNELAGTCETGAVFAWRLIQKMVPDVRFATVRRPVADVCNSLAAFGLTGLEDEMYARDALLDELERAGPHVRRVAFSDLAQPEICARLHQHCTGRSMDQAWWAALDPLNIQVDMARQLALITRNAPQIEALKAQVREMMTDA